MGKASAEKRKKQHKATHVQPTLTHVERRNTVNDNVNVNVNDNKNVSIIDREAEFKNSLQPFLETYGSDLLNAFYLYWTEKKPKGRKMLFEMQKTFDISRRLQRWSLNNFDKKNVNQAPKLKRSAAEIIQEEIRQNL